MNQLAPEEISQFRKTYAEIATDNVITGDKIASNKTKFISGLDEYNS